MVAGTGKSGQFKAAMFSAFRISACLAGLASVLGAAAPFQVTIGPAPVERAAQVVSLTLPRELAAGATLRDERGQIVPLQAESDLTARFIVARQAAGQTLKFTLEPGRQPDQGNVQVVEEPSPPRPGNTPGIASATSPSRIQEKTGRLRVSVGGRPILYYQMDRDAVPREDIDPTLRRAGYLHPVLTPGGFAVTEGFPPDSVPTQPVSPGIAASGPIIQRSQVRRSASRDTDNAEAPLEFGGVDNIWSGPVHGGFASWQRWTEDIGPGSAALVNESWELTAYAVPKTTGEINLFDIVITQTNATNVPVKYDEWGLNVAGSAAWRKADSPAQAVGHIFPAEIGAGKMPHWVGLTGNGKDRPASLAVLLPTAGFWAFGGGPTAITALAQGELFQLAPGARSVLRHRFVVFDGPPENTLLEALWNGYTVPAVVTISATDGR